jgi:hypothetical protein
VIADAICFFPNIQPALEDAEKNGLPPDVLESARFALSEF